MGGGIQVIKGECMGWGLMETRVERCSLASDLPFLPSPGLDEGALIVLVPVLSL